MRTAYVASVEPEVCEIYNDKVRLVKGKDGKWNGEPWENWVDLAITIIAENNRRTNTTKTMFEADYYINYA